MNLGGTLIGGLGAATSDLAPGPARRTGLGLRLRPSAVFPAVFGQALLFLMKLIGGDLTPGVSHLRVR